jgi:hypothetical protein
MTEAVSEPMERPDDAGRRDDLRPRVLPGIPWVVGIFVGATVSYLVLRVVFNAIGAGPTPLMSIGTMLIGAAIATAFALAGFWPLARIANPITRATLLLVLALVLAFAFWTVFAGLYRVDMVLWSFPIIATVWWWIAATSFIGEDAHLAGLPAARRTALNAVLWIAGTALILVTFVWIPPFWFGFIQTLLITGGFAYLLRHVRQPTKSLYAWGILIALTGLAIVVSIGLGIWDTSTNVGPWAIGSPTAGWGIFFGLWCGLNFGVLALIQCWPFSRVRQPWGSTVAVLVVIAWSALIAWIAAAVFSAFFADPAVALLEAQVWAWHTVFWGFCFALLYGIGSAPYLWAGQKTPGTWEDIDTAEQPDTAEHPATAEDTGSEPVDAPAARQN